MDTQKAFLVILVVLIVVILLNLGIYSYAKKLGSQFKLFSRVYHRAQDPWKEDKAKLEELSESVAMYKTNIDEINKEDSGDSIPS